MPEFTDPAKLAKHIEKALGELKKEVVVTSQARLGSTAVSPRETGRLRSSWFAAEGSASSSTPAEGADSPQTDAQGLTVDPKKEYHLTSNLPYSEAVALGTSTPASWGGQNQVKSADPNWFLDFVNNETPKIAKKAGEVVKRRFDL